MHHRWDSSSSSNDDDGCATSSWRDQHQQRWRRRRAQEAERFQIAFRNSQPPKRGEQWRSLLQASGRALAIVPFASTRRGGSDPTTTAAAASSPADATAARTCLSRFCIASVLFLALFSLMHERSIGAWESSGQDEGDDAASVLALGCPSYDLTSLASVREVWYAGTQLATASSVASLLSWLCAVAASGVEQTVSWWGVRGWGPRDATGGAYPRAVCHLQRVLRAYAAQHPDDGGNASAPSTVTTVKAYRAALHLQQQQRRSVDYYDAEPLAHFLFAASPTTSSSSSSSPDEERPGHAPGTTAATAALPSAPNMPPFCDALAGSAASTSRRDDLTNAAAAHIPCVPPPPRFTVRRELPHRPGRGAYPHRVAYFVTPPFQTILDRHSGHDRRRLVLETAVWHVFVARAGVRCHDALLLRVHPLEAPSSSFPPSSSSSSAEHMPQACREFRELLARL